MIASNRKFKRWTSTFMAALLLISTFLPSSFIGRAHAEQADHVVISQYFGGGGNSGAPYKNDFIELYNPTNEDIVLDNWSVQYASTSGTSWQVTPLKGTIKAHGYYLIGEGAGAGNGVDLPAVDASGALAMSGTGAKIALFKDKTTAASGTKPDDTVDFVGMGSANAYEGLAATKAPSNTTSVQRRPYANVDPSPSKGNAWDTDDNAADFYVGPVAAPRNTASPTEEPMVPVTSLQPNGMNIQFLQDGTSAKVTGLAEAAEANSTINIYETASKGTALATGTANADGSFDISFTTTLSTVYVAATQTDLAESAAIKIDLATASAQVAQAKLSYVVTDGAGTLIGGVGAAAANGIINVYPNETATKEEQLNTQEVKAGTSGDFSVTIKNAPNTVYVTQITSSATGIKLESVPVSVTKADTTAVSKLADVRASDSKGQPVNLNKFFTVEGVATVDNQILGTQKQNFYLQDDTAGINIFSSSLDIGYKVLKGDKLRITGKVLVYNGLTEFEPTSIEKISEGNAIPTPKNLTILDLNTYVTAEPIEGSLVTISGKVSAVTGGPNYNVTFVDENNKTTTIRVMGATGIKPDTDLIIGKSYVITGVLGQYTTNASATNGYQVYPREVKDIAPILGITHTALTQVYKDTNVEFEANADGAESVTVYYRAKDATEYTALPMVNGGDGRYTATLNAADVPQSGFEYYIEAKAGTQVQSAGTSAVPYAVALVADETGPAITGETPQSGDKVESPTPEISALLDDPSGVDDTTVHFWLDGQELTAPAATISRTQVKYVPESDLALGTHTVKVSAKDSKGNLNEKEWTFEVVPRFTGGNHYRGTTHNHTNISHDGAGTPEDALKAGKAHHYDWFAFSDHSHDIDPEKLGTDTVVRDGMQERTGGSQWQLTKDLAKQYTTSDYVVFPAFEMTSTTWGHSNIFGTDNFIDRNINGKQYQDLNQYYAWVMTYDDIVGQFNHPDMSANAFNNFKPYNKDVDKLFTMLEVGNGSGHYGYANAETKFYSALDLGWHVAPTYGEDNHEGTWGQVNARTVIVADDLSQASLLHSMRNMRVYMEEDPNFTLDVLANGYYMGSTVDSKKLSFKITGSDLVAEAHNDSDYNYLPTSYKSDDRISKVELITNGGKVVDSYSPMEKEFTWNPSYTVTGGQQWFVVKVTQMDGERIYSAPIWSKEEAVDVKVNSIDVDGGAIVGGNPATLKATVANNGTEVVKNLKVDFYYDEVKPENLIGTNNISSILSKGSAVATATWASPIKGDHKLIAVVTSLDGLDLGDTTFTVPVQIKEPLGIKVLIDANHGNENTSADGGTYKDNLKAFTLMLQKEGYTVVENKVALTDDVLSSVKVLVLTHARTALTADENAAVAKFVKNGGSLLMAGKSNNSTDPTINNVLLSDIGSSIRLGNDGVFDDSKTGNFWSDPKVSPYAVRLHPGLVSNYITDRVSFIDYYSGTSLSGVDNQALTESGKVVILAKGNETTYQGNIKGGYTYDSISDTTGGSAIPMIASEEIGDQGRIVVSGMNIFNDKQMDESFEPKGNDEFTLNTINWLAHRETKVSNIADVRTLADGTDVVVEGTVVTGAGNFFDAFYVQDATGGIMAFQEVPEGSIKPGDKVRVYGHIKTFENNKELEFTTFANDVIKLGSGDPVQPKQVATGEATSAANQGLLVKVKGTVVSKFDENSYVINDGSGDVLVFTDGYIVNQSGPVPDLSKGDTLEAVGLSGAFAQGTRIRVRDTKELVGTIAPDTTAPEAPVVQPVSENDTVISGTAEAGATVVAKVDGQEIGKATADAEGKFTITIEKQVAGKKIIVTAADATGNISTEVTVTVSDATAPKTPIAYPVSKNDVVITGTAEVNATVIAKVGSQEIGKAVADAEGKFSITIEKQAAGTKILVTAVDAAGNESNAYEVIVMNVIAPSVPELIYDVTQFDTFIAGYADAGSNVEVRVKDKLIGSGIADEDGYFEIEIPAQAVGTVLVLTATDAASNVSEKVETTVIKAETGWIEVDKNVWLYIDPVTGELVSGWLEIAGKKYFLDEEEYTMVTGWKEIDGSWFYFAGNGSMLSNAWVLSSGKWYYVAANGKMATNKWILSNGKWYFVDNNGVMKTNSWIQSGKKWYYVDAKGIMKASSWVQLSGKWYYLNADGSMATGWIKVSNKWYYLYNDGHMAVNTMIGKYKIGKDGAWIQ
ncbi:Ig-like domain-containing protein [Neobacillus bataviensis]|uniref:Ig-like domain-containing protein n=1 Tax=Neobacillus bataviensis TaxID=220685 RepID=UPI001CBF412A|nr:Ig-like domain-containing protein [Neobacillus bataviensis]